MSPRSTQAASELPRFLANTEPNERRRSTLERLGARHDGYQTQAVKLYTAKLMLSSICNSTPAPHPR